MTKPKPATNHDQLQKALDRAENKSISARILAITKRRKVRDVTFRKVENLYQAAKQITSSRVLSALAVHRRGEIMLNECSNCREGKGNFTECVTMKGYLTDCCTSCYLVYKTMADQKTRADQKKAYCNLELEDRVLQRAISSGFGQRLQPVSQLTTLVPPIPLHFPPQLPRELKGLTEGRMEALEEHQISLDLSEESQEVKNKDGYHIGGLLFLSDLTKAGLQDDHLTKALTLKPEFAKLHKRDRSSFRKPIKDMTEAFQTFSDKELQAWETSVKAGTAQEIPPSRYLLRPSGSLKSEVIHHLNQPSYTSNFGYGLEMADPSNGCIAMVMGNLFDRDKSLIFDQIHQRERESRGLEEFPEPVVNCHNDVDLSEIVIAASKLSGGLSALT